MLLRDARPAQGAPQTMRATDTASAAREQPSEALRMRLAMCESIIGCDRQPAAAAAARTAVAFARIARASVARRTEVTLRRTRRNQRMAGRPPRVACWSSGPSATAIPKPAAGLSEWCPVNGSMPPQRLLCFHVCTIPDRRLFRGKCIVK